MLGNGIPLHDWVALDIDLLPAVSDHPSLKNAVKSSVYPNLVAITQQFDDSTLPEPPRFLAALFPDSRSLLHDIPTLNFQSMCEALHIPLSSLLEEISNSLDITSINGPNMETTIVSTSLQLYQILLQISRSNTQPPEDVGLRISLAMRLFCGSTPAPPKHPILPFALLIGGTSGSGKSTVALAAQKLLSVGGEKEFLQTDEIRNEMRLAYPKTHLIWRSTYNVADTLFDGSESSKRTVLDGFEAQAAMVEKVVFEKIPAHFAHPLVLEGVHVTPSFAEKLKAKIPLQCLAIFLRVPDANEHCRRLETRAPKSASVTPASDASHKYLHYFDNIRCISDHILSDAERLHYRVLDNCELQEALKIILQDLLDLLVSQQNDSPIIIKSK